MVGCGISTLLLPVADMDNSIGMFLWARLVLEYLTTNMFVRKSEVMESIDTLPRKLSDFYGQILAQLMSHFDNRSVGRLQSILGWIAFAKRPLRKAELRAALSFLPEEENVHLQELAPNFLFDMCSPLVEERSDTTFAFVHVSVKEYVLFPSRKLQLMLTIPQGSCRAQRAVSTSTRSA